MRIQPCPSKLDGMQHRRIPKRAGAVVTAAAIGPAALAAVLPQAASASPPPYCPGNTLCLYRDPGFGGSIAFFNPRGSDDNYAAHDGYAANTFVDGSPLDDRVSSIWNNSNRYVQFCQNPNCGNGSTVLCLEPGVAVSSLYFYSYSFDNMISAHHTNSPYAMHVCTVDRTAPQGCSL
jgi:Peptidase inhibitor family I36